MTKPHWEATAEEFANNWDRILSKKGKTNELRP